MLYLIHNFINIL